MNDGKRRPARVLIFELNWLGDILFSVPLIRAVRAKLPDAYIACAVVPRYVDLFLSNPWINYVHALSDENDLGSLGSKIAFINMIRRERYDTCFILKPSRMKTVMALLAGIPNRIGFRGKNAPLTEDVELPEGVHRIDQILALTGAVGIKKADGEYEYFVSEYDRERAIALLREAGGGTKRTIVINPGGNWDAKRWPWENYRDIAKFILGSYSDVEIAVAGSEKDKLLAGGIVTAVGDKRCYSVAGLTALNTLAALLKGSELVISADSGPLHLASAVGTATIALFGPTSPKITGPRGKGRITVIQHDTGCRVPCYESECVRSYECMRSITAGEVFEAAKRML